MDRGSVLRRLSETPESGGTISPSTFDAEGSIGSNTVGERSRFARFRAPTATRVKTGRSNPLRLALPAFEEFTSDGTTGNSETFTLSHSVVDAPATQPVVVYIGGDRYGTPDAVDFDADTIDVTDPGSDNSVYVFYTSDEPAEVEIERATPSSSASAQEVIFRANLGLVHQAEQQEEPEFVTLERDLQAFLAADMTLDVQVDAPYSVRYTDPNGDGATADNTLLHIPAGRAKGKVRGLKAVLSASMN